MFRNNFVCRGCTVYMIFLQDGGNFLNRLQTTQGFELALKMLHICLVISISFISYTKVLFTNFIYHNPSHSFCLEAVAQRCSVKKVFLQISQNPQENNCARASFLIKLQVLLIKLQAFFQWFSYSCYFTRITINTIFLKLHYVLMLFQTLVFAGVAPIFSYLLSMQLILLATVAVIFSQILLMSVMKKN